MVAQLLYTQFVLYLQEANILLHHSLEFSKILDVLLIQKFIVCFPAFGVDRKPVLLQNVSILK